MTTTTNPLSNVAAKAERLETLTASVQKVVEQAARTGLDFNTQQGALDASLTNARVQRRAIDAALAAASETETAEKNATTLLVCTIGMLLSSSSDPRATGPAELARMTPAELLGIADEFAGRTTHVTPIVEGLVPLLPAIKSRFLALQAAAAHARSDVHSARNGWASAVLRLEATITSVRSDLMAVGIRTLQRRPAKPKPASQGKLTTVGAPTPADQSPAPSRVG